MTNTFAPGDKVIDSRCGDPIEGTVFMVRGNSVYYKDNCAGCLDGAHHRCQANAATTHKTTAATPAETLEQEYDRLLAERAAIQAAARKAGGASSEQRAQMTAVMDRIRDILAIPPDGYTLPTQAAKLIAHAHAHGWLGEAQWTPPGWHGEPFVAVKVGRWMQPGELQYSLSDAWLYKLTWHSRGCPPGKLRLFGSGLCRTPEYPVAQTMPAPSVKTITAVITQHPGPDAAPLALF